MFPLQALAVLPEDPLEDVGIDVGNNQCANLVDRQVDPAQGGDQPGRADLIAPVAPVARVIVHTGGGEQPDVVVVTQSMDGQSAQLGEPSDVHELGRHASTVTSRVTQESTGTPAASSAAAGSELQDDGHASAELTAILRRL